MSSRQRKKIAPHLVRLQRIHSHIYVMTGVWRQLLLTFFSNLSLLASVRYAS